MGCKVTRHQAESPRALLKQPNLHLLEDRKVNKILSMTAGDLVSLRQGNIQQDYNILRPIIGKGAYGEVRKAIHRQTGLVRAIKIIRKVDSSESYKQKLLNEVEILRKLDHPNIIKIYEFYHDDRFFYIVTELCTGGELFQRLVKHKSFSEKTSAMIIKQVLSAVHYCHTNNVVHRDLKPENMLIETDKEDCLIKVIDFGTSRTFTNSKQMTQKFGTPYYIAPEVLRKNYSEKCDEWSCGVILYILLCGYPPFNGHNKQEIMQKVVLGKFSLQGPEWKKVSKEAKALVKKLLTYDSAQRISAKEALQEKWIKKYIQTQPIENEQLEMAFENMKRFKSSQTELQEQAYAFIVNFLTSRDEKAKLMKIFQSLDTDGDGLLSKQEVLQGYKKVFHQNKSEQIVNALMSQIDVNNSGYIDYTEWVMATINKDAMLTKQKIQTAFRMFDKDGSGTLSVQELKDNLGGEHVSEQEWDKVMKENSLLNQQREISQKDFKIMMRKLLDENQGQ